MNLNKLSDNRGAKTAAKRLGRGIGSGTGKTCGRGQKGQKSRSGVSLNGFEGGQTPIYRRLPKRGFNNKFAVVFEIISFGQLQDFIDRKKIDPKKIINTDVLLHSGLVRRIKHGVKLLCTGQLKQKINLQVNAASKSSVEYIEKLGGTIELVSYNKDCSTDDLAIVNKNSDGSSPKVKKSNSSVDADKCKEASSDKTTDITVEKDKNTINKSTDSVAKSTVKSKTKAVQSTKSNTKKTISVKDKE